VVVVEPFGRPRAGSFDHGRNVRAQGRLVEARFLLSADVHCVRAAWMEATARWRVEIIRDSPRDTIGDTAARQPGDGVH